MVLTCIRLRATPVGRIGYDRLDGFLERDPKELDRTQRRCRGSLQGKRQRQGIHDLYDPADTMFGVTFMVLAPESELVQQLTTADQKAEVDAYLDRTKKRTERDASPTVR